MPYSHKDFSLLSTEQTTNNLREELLAKHLLEIHKTITEVSISKTLDFSMAKCTVYGSYDHIEPY